MHQEGTMSGVEAVSVTAEAKDATRLEGTITEDEASLYDRQIRLWGLEAQNRMRSSTILLLSLRSLAHETIKNLVLAGVGRLIVMDDGVVTEEDLGSGFLFRENDGAVGKSRTEAALPQIKSLNPLVELTAFSTLSPFHRSPTSDMTISDARVAMVELLKREKVDVIVAVGLPNRDLVEINTASREAGSMFYAADSYGFYGYVFADLGANFETVVTGPTHNINEPPKLLKRSIQYAPLSEALDQEAWKAKKGNDVGGGPYRGLSKIGSKERAPSLSLGVLAVWEYENRHGHLPSSADATKELVEIADHYRQKLEVNIKCLPQIDESLMEHLALHATHHFAPTLAILGGLLAQDVLRALSCKEKPIINLLAVDSMGGIGAVGKWGNVVEKDA